MGFYLFYELNEVVDVKHLFSVNLPPLHTNHGGSFPCIQCVPGSPAVTFQGGVAGIWKAFNQRLFMFGLLVPVSDVTWQISTHPVLISHSSLALFISRLLETFFAHIPTVMYFYSHLYSIKNDLGLRVS